MSYNTFLVTLSQLMCQQKAHIDILGNAILIEKIGNHRRWQLSTKVFDGDGYLPAGVKDCVSSSGLLRWQEGGAYLKLDPESHKVFLVHEISPFSKYIPFKYMMNDFIQVANEWREFFEGQEGAFLRGSRKS